MYGVHFQFLTSSTGYGRGFYFLIIKLWKLENNAFPGPLLNIIEEISAKTIFFRLALIVSINIIHPLKIRLTSF